MTRTVLVAAAVVALAATKPASPKHPHAAAPSPTATPGVAALSLSSAGVPVLPLDLSIELRGETVKPLPASAPRARLTWLADGEAQVGSAHGGGWDATLRLVPVDGAVSLDVELRYLAASVVEKEALRIRLPGNAHAIARDLSWKPVDGIQRVDRGTPILVATSSLVVSGGSGFVAARYLPGRWRGGPFTDAELILDDAAAHPFGTYDQCLDKLPTADENDPNAPVNWTELEKKTPHDRITRAAGAVVRAHATILLPAAAPATPLIVERWPAGARAAFVLTDHADRTDPNALRAVLYGTSDTSSPDYGKKGLFAHHLAITKTFFSGHSAGSLSTNKEAKVLADEIVAAGSEVGAHSITSSVDSRETVRKSLSDFDPWHSVTWIDHEPYTNCEALSNLGWKTDGPYVIRDLLVAHQYRWIWPATDLAAFKDSKLTDLFGGAPSLAEPAFYPFPPDPRLWVFRSVWFYSTPATLAKAIDDKPLLALEAARGLFVGHTYLSASLATTRIEEHKSELAVKKSKSGALELDAKLEEAFARLEAHVNTGRLASMTWRDAGDRLVALGEVDVSYGADGSAVVTNRGATEIKALTIAVPLEAGLTVDGAVASDARHEDARTTLWFDLPAGAHAVVHASRAGAPLPFVSARKVTLSPR